MTVQELKDNILQNKLSDSFLVLKYNDNKFIAEQYIHEIAAVKHLNIKYINSIQEITLSALSLILDFSDTLYVVNTDEFTELLDTYDDIINIIVVCNKISKTVLAGVEQYIVEIPDLIFDKQHNSWQLTDYAQTLCPGLSNSSCELLAKLTAYDVYRFTNELDKIKLFSVEDQDAVVNRLINTKNSDLVDCPDIFNLVEAVVNQNLNILYEWLRTDKLVKNYNKIEQVNAIQLTNLLLTKYKSLLYFKANPEQPLEQLGITRQAQYYLSMTKTQYSISSLEKIIKFLSTIDMRLKNYEFEEVLDIVPEYLICSILAIGI